MKRLSIQDSFIGEGNPNQEGVRASSSGEDAVELAITGGRILIVVPSGTPDDQVFEAQERVLGEILLEDGTTLSFTIEDDSTGAQIGITRGNGLRRFPSHASLSSIDVPSTS